MQTSEIKLTVTLDENKLPISINWEASDGEQKGNCKAMMFSFWDEKEQNTLRIDLWTKDMLVDEMKKFFHQSLLTMSDTLKRATGEEKMAEEMKDFCEYFAEKMNVLSKG